VAAPRQVLLVIGSADVESFRGYRAVRWVCATRIHRYPKAVGRSARQCETDEVPPRFLQLADVAELLNISAAQTYALVRSGELAAIKVGGRGQWRVETTELEAYIQRMYSETREFVQSHPFGPGADD
jgi:excisionase family DNA binding protein